MFSHRNVSKSQKLQKNKLEVLKQNLIRHQENSILNDIKKTKRFQVVTIYGVKNTQWRNNEVFSLLKLTELAKPLLSEA